MLNIDSGLGIEFEGGRMILAVVRKGLREFAVSGQLVVEGYEEVPEAELRTRLQRFVQAHSFNRENIVAGIPRNEVVVRQVELPLEVDENLDQVVRFQVERFDPSPDETSCYDCVVLDRDLQQERLLLQIVMARQERLQRYLALLRQMGLFPQAVRFGSSGLGALLGAHRDGLPAKKGVLLVRLSKRRVDVVAFGPGAQLFSESLERSDPESEVDSDWLLGEVHGQLRRWGLEARRFAKLYLAGASDSLFGTLRRQLADVEILRTGLKLKGPDGGLATEAFGAAGLAIQAIRRGKGRINLIPSQQRVVAEHASLVPTLVLAGLLVLLLGGVAIRHFLQQSALLEQVDDQISRLQPSVQGVLELRDQLNARQQDLAELQQLLRGRQTALGVVRTLTDRLPDDTYLSTLQLQDTNLTIQGYSDSASRLPILLLDSPLFETVKTDWITQDPRVKGKDRFKFSATVKQ